MSKNISNNTQATNQNDNTQVIIEKATFFLRNIVKHSNKLLNNNDIVRQFYLRKLDDENLSKEEQEKAVNNIIYCNNYDLQALKLVLGTCVVSGVVFIANNGIPIKHIHVYNN